MTVEPIRRIRAAIYTRKSSEEGLVQAFNGLDAQREACEAYIASRRPRAGWRCPTGSTTPASRAAPSSGPPAAPPARSGGGPIDIVITYKLDRLSRDLTDFVKLSSCSTSTA